MRLIKTDFGGAKCVECKQEKATKLLKLGKRKDGYFLCEYCQKRLGRFLLKNLEKSDLEGNNERV